MTIKKRGRPPKVTDNKDVADWLIKNKWKDLGQDVRSRLPDFVHDAVYGALYICAGTSNGKLNIQPELIYRCIMQPEISTQSTSNILEFLETPLAPRTVERITQVSRFAAKGIRERIEQYEERRAELRQTNVDWKIEMIFLKDYYQGRYSRYYSAPLQKVPDSITQLYRDRKYLEYGEKLREFRTNSFLFTVG